MREKQSLMQVSLSIKISGTTAKTFNCFFLKSQDRSFPPTLIEMKKLAIESSRFRTEEIPPRHRDKQHLNQLFRDLDKYFKAIGEVEIEQELHIEKIEKHWSRLMVAYQERDKHIMEEMKRLEKLQRLAEKVHR